MDELLEAFRLVAYRLEEVHLVSRRLEAFRLEAFHLVVDLEV